MKTFRRLLSYLKYEIRPFVLGLFLLLVSTIATLTGPIIAKYLIDQVITPMEQTRVFEWETLLQGIGLYFVVTGIGYLCVYLNRVVMKNLSNRIAKRLRDEVFEHVQTLPISYYE